MRRLFTLGLAALAGIGSSSVSHAQAPAEDSVVVSLAGVNRLEEDLKATMSLAPKGAAQFPNFKASLLDAFTAGVDPQKPIRLDLMLGTSDDWRLWVPVTNHKNFQTNNVQLIVIKPAKKLMDNFFEWKGNGWATGGYERFNPKTNTSVLAPNRQLLPSTMPDAAAHTASMLANDVDLALEVSNGAKNIKMRRDRLQKVRTELAAKIKQLGDEDVHEFELRKLSHEQQFDEAERFYAESEKLWLGWTLDAAKKQGVLDLKLKALPGTELEKCIKELATSASTFAPISTTAATTGYARINHALDAMRQKHLKDFLAVVKKQAAARIKSSAKIKDAHKAPYAKAADQFIDLLIGGVDMAIIDGFAHTEKEGDRQVMLGALRVPDGKALVPVLETLKDAEWKVQTNVETVGEIALHVLQIPQRDDSDFSALFDNEATLVVGTGPNVVWYAAGKNGLDRVKAGIAKNNTAEKPQDGVFLELFGNLHPWMQFLLDRRARVTVDEKKLTEADRTMRKSKENLLKTAVEAFKDGDATVHMKLQRQENEVTGRTTLSEGALRFGGQKLTDIAGKF